MTSPTPTKANLTHLYRYYIACLNAQDWNSLGNFVADKVTHNGKAFGKLRIVPPGTQIDEVTFSPEEIVVLALTQRGSAALSEHRRYRGLISS